MRCHGEKGCRDSLVSAEVREAIPIYEQKKKAKRRPGTPLGTLGEGKRRKGEEPFSHGSKEGPWEKRKGQEGCEATRRPGVLFEGGGGIVLRRPFSEFFEGDLGEERGRHTFFLAKVPKLDVDALLSMRGTA